jgi:hypothetical protein
MTAGYNNCLMSFIICRLPSKMIESGRIMWAGYGQLLNTYNILVINLKVRDHPGDLGLGGGVILK